MRYAHIVGWGKFLPSRIMTNDDISKLVDTSDAWIRDRTGISERRIAGDHESTSTLATQAAIAALDVAGITASQIDLIIVATSTPENFFPSVACAVQDALGAEHAGAFDVSAACSGFVYALATGSDAIKAGSANYVLVIGAETTSRILDWTDRNTCVLFGDGAGGGLTSQRPAGRRALAGVAGRWIGRRSAVCVREWQWPQSHQPEKWRIQRRAARCRLAFSAHERP